MKVPWPVSATLLTLQQMVSAITAGWSVEHKSDGTHDWGWTAPAFDANRFRGDGTITWTVSSANRTREHYGVLGDWLEWTMRIDNSSTGGSASTTLRVSLPDGYRVAAYAFEAAAIHDNGTWVGGTVEALPGESVVSVRRLDAGNLSAASANNTFVIFTAGLRVTK